MLAGLVLAYIAKKKLKKNKKISAHFIVIKKIVAIRHVFRKETIFLWLKHFFYFSLCFPYEFPNKIPIKIKFFEIQGNLFLNLLCN